MHERPSAGPPSLPPGSPGKRAKADPQASGATHLPADIALSATQLRPEPRFALYGEDGLVVVCLNRRDYPSLLFTGRVRHWAIAYLDGFRACIRHLSAETRKWQDDLSHQAALIHRWQHQPADLASEVVRYWDASPSPRVHAKVCVADMADVDPEMWDHFASTSGWAGTLIVTGPRSGAQRLTGMQHPCEPVFTDDEDFSARLSAAISHALYRPSPMQQSLWALQIPPGRYNALQAPSVGDDLRSFLALHFDTWVTIGTPWGVLARDRSGQLCWTQLVLQSELAAMSESLWRAGVRDELVRQVVEGSAIIDTDPLREHRRAPGATDLRPAFPLGNGSKVFAAQRQLSRPRSR